MQMLLDESEEFGLTEGLHLIPGRVVQVPAETPSGQRQKIPHIGWSSLVLPRGRADWHATPLRNLAPGVAAYFVHSFMASPFDPTHRVADCSYGGVPVSAAIGKDNIFGCQFHPEKSGEAGLAILRAFLTT
jgi:glutamine amidotransferase